MVFILRFCVCDTLCAYLVFTRLFVSLSCRCAIVAIDMVPGLHHFHTLGLLTSQFASKNVPQCAKDAMCQGTSHILLQSCKALGKALHPLTLAQSCWAKSIQQSRSQALQFQCCLCLRLLCRGRPGRPSLRLSFLPFLCLSFNI